MLADTVHTPDTIRESGRVNLLAYWVRGAGGHYRGRTQSAVTPGWFSWFCYFGLQDYSVD